LELPQVFFVDFGHTLLLKHEMLFRFPRECAALPFQAIHFTVTDMPPYGSDTKIANLIILKEFSFAMANVE
jgi:hypothetical protein